MEAIGDALAPCADLQVGDNTYKLCFTFGALAEAKRLLRREGVQVNLLLSLDSLDVDVDTMRPLLYAALRTHHPDVSYLAASDMVTLRNAASVFTAICRAYQESVRIPAGTGAPESPSGEPKD